MPKTVKEFEQVMISAFKLGMIAGYGIEHENIHEEEKREVIDFCEKNNFRYYGKINEPLI